MLRRVVSFNIDLKGSGDVRMVRVQVETGNIGF